MHIEAARRSDVPGSTLVRFEAAIQAGQGVRVSELSPGLRFVSAVNLAEAPTLARKRAQGADVAAWLVTDAEGAEFAIVRWPCKTPRAPVVVGTEQLGDFTKLYAL